MQQLQKKINSYIDTGICYAVLMILLGVVMLVFPGLSLDIIRWTIAIVLIAGGILLVVNDLRRQTVASMFSGSVLGVGLLIMGIVVIVYPDVLGIIPIILGAYMIISSVMTLRLATSLKNVSNTSFYLALITSIVAIICGIILIANPLGGAIAITSLIGAIGIIYGISGLVDLIVFRHNIDEIAKYIKSQTKVIEGKEVKESK